ncbi:DMT family transporter [Candidatus Kapabacteria bacterium]|nr:DMT family transporter [Candidatus Kapabacteria bacterium]
MKVWKAELMLLLMTMIWGATFLFTKMGIDSVTPVFYLILRFSLALALLLIFFGKYFLKIDKSLIWKGILLGGIFGLGFILQTKGLEYTKIQKSAFITGLTVALTPFTFKLISKKKIALFSWIGVVVATIGLYIFTNPTIDTFNIGDVYTVLSTFCWAFFITFLDKFTKDDHSFAYTIRLVFLQVVGTLLVCTIFFFGLDSESYNSNFYLDNELIISVVFNGLLASFLLMIIHTNYQRYTSPVKAALIFSLEPVFASIVALIFTTEVLTGLEYIGASVLFFGVLISELGSYIFKIKSQ